MRRWGIWLGGLALAACYLDTSGLGSSGSLIGNDDTTGGETSVGPVDSANSADGSAGLGDQAQLSLWATPYRFERLLPGQEAQATLTVRNTAQIEARGITAAPLSAPFGYTGGVFPGTAGDCTSVLPAQTSCAVEVSFRPSAPGDFEAPLTLMVDNGPEATGILEGEAGDSDNLLVNPGGEDQGSPPPGWTVTGPGTWVAGDPFDVPDPVEGQSYLGANMGPNNEMFRMRQDVAIDQWAALVDREMVRLRFEAHACSFQEGDDPYEIAVRYLDEEGEVLETWNSGRQTSASWQLHDHDRVVPADTRTVRVVLACDKGRGQFCDAFFDQLSLRVTAP